MYKSLAPTRRIPLGLTSEDTRSDSEDAPRPKTRRLTSEETRASVFVLCRVSPPA